MKKPLEKRYIVRKYIMATSASHALKKERKFKADECWIDDKWLDDQNKSNPSAIGFAMRRHDKDDY